jgi:thiol-disulfide isomerase/thioredoxin
MSKETTDISFEQDVLNSSKPVLVDFWAEWCGPCRQLSPIVDELSKDRSDKIQKDFSKERIKYINSKLVLSTFDIDEMELFEKIKLSRDVPYCKKDNFNKVLKSFIPPDQLLEEKSNKIIMYVLSKKNEPVSNIETPKDYNYSKIYLNKNGNSLEIFIESKLEGVDYNFDVKEENIIERIINSLDISSKLSSI